GPKCIPRRESAADRKQATEAARSLPKFRWRLVLGLKGQQTSTLCQEGSRRGRSSASYALRNSDPRAVHRCRAIHWTTEGARALRVAGPSVFANVRLRALFPSDSG